MAENRLTDILRDTRLSTDARVVAMEIHARGEGPHEVSFDAWSMLLSQAGDHRIRRALKQAELAGWIERQPGGGGHSDRFESRVPKSVTLSSGKGAKSSQPKDSLPESTTLLDPKGGKSDHPTPDSLPESTTLGGDSRGGAVEGGGDGGEAGEAGARGEISERASEAMDRHGDLLKGCRDSLRDYLAERVPTPTRQLGYVQRVAGWLQGTDRRIWEGKDGRPIPEERRTAVIADALNGLLAGEEGKMKRPVGDPDNLRTKITVLIAMQENPYRSRSGANGSPAESDDDFVPAELGG